MIYIDLIFRMNQAVHVDVSVKTVITLLWNVLLYDNIRRQLLVILRIYSEIDLNVILYANTELPINQNKNIFRAVRLSKRKQYIWLIMQVSQPLPFTYIL